MTLFWRVLLIAYLVATGVVLAFIALIWNTPAAPGIALLITWIGLPWSPIVMHLSFAIFGESPTAVVVWFAGSVSLNVLVLWKLGKKKHPVPPSAHGPSDAGRITESLRIWWLLIVPIALSVLIGWLYDYASLASVKTYADLHTRHLHRGLSAGYATAVVVSALILPVLFWQNLRRKLLVMWALLAPPIVFLAIAGLQSAHTSARLDPWVRAVTGFFDRLPMNILEWMVIIALTYLVSVVVRKKRASPTGA